MPKFQLKLSDKNFSDELIEKICRVHKESFENPWSFNSFKKLIYSSEHILFWLEDKDIAGFCLIRNLVDEAEIITIAVLPEFRKQGLGGSLILKAINHLTEIGFKKIFLEVSSEDKSVISFYEKYGFKEFSIRKNYYIRKKRQVDAINMALEL